MILLFSKSVCSVEATHVLKPAGFSGVRLVFARGDDPDSFSNKGGL